MGAGEVCGAIAGGVLSIGLIYGENHHDAVGVLSEDYLNRIAGQEGTVTCKEIIGTDISGAMNAEDFRSAARLIWVFFIRGKRKICSRVVRSAVRVVLEQWQEWEA